ncbi:MAG: hypothetical protein R2701_00215 [Acidimicrobiales bacterium]
MGVRERKAAFVAPSPKLPRADQGRGGAERLLDDLPQVGCGPSLDREATGLRQVSFQEAGLSRQPQRLGIGRRVEPCGLVGGEQPLVHGDQVTGDLDAGNRCELLERAGSADAIGDGLDDRSPGGPEHHQRVDDRRDRKGIHR